MEKAEQTINFVNSLLEERYKIRQRLKTIDETIENIQSLCDHKNDDGSSAFLYEYHTSHETIYVCKICNKEKYE